MWEISDKLVHLLESYSKNKVYRYFPVTMYHPTPSNFSTHPLPAHVCRMGSRQLKIWWYHSIEKNMGFNSRVGLAWNCNQLFRENGKKLRKRQMSKYIFEIFSMKEAQIIKNMVIFGILVQFPIGICPQKLILTYFND